jgi:hypothetical protein
VTGPASAPGATDRASAPRTEEVVLIGPSRAGKSTQARLLSEALGLPRLSVDRVRFRYYEEIGYDPAFAQRLRAAEGHFALGLYWREFQCHAVERILAEHHGCVFDFGAGHSVYENRNQLERVKRALARVRHVLLLLPSPDLARSTRILSERNGFVPAPGRLNPIEHMVHHPSSFELARLVVYTEGRSPEQTRDEILSRIGSRASGRAG